MPKPSDRSKKEKRRKGIKGKAKRVFARGKSSKHKCNNCGRVMHGMPHGKTKAKTKKLGKTEKRASALFAGQLCNKCRAIVVEDAAKIKAGIKKKEAVNLKLKKYVEEALKGM